MPLMSDAALLEDPELTDAAWNLEDLVDGEGEAGPHARLDEALRRAEAFAERYAGRVASFSPGDLGEAMQELVAIQELASRAGYYASLAFSVDTADPARGALMQKVQERATALQTTLLFFEL